MLYTGKGDNGTTRLLNSGEERISKSSLSIKALGSLDELNSFLGLCKARLNGIGDYFEVDEQSLALVLHNIQEDLFIIQAEVAGDCKKISREKLKKLEEITEQIESKLPPIKGFSIAGQSEISALFDVVRTVARKTEREVIAAVDSQEISISDETKAYLNRLSSLLFACARFINKEFGLEEKTPNY